jgi:hypothetical protein
VEILALSIEASVTTEARNDRISSWGKSASEVIVRRPGALPVRQRSSVPSQHTGGAVQQRLKVDRSVTVDS